MNKYKSRPKVVPYHFWARIYIDMGYWSESAIVNHATLTDDEATLSVGAATRKVLANALCVSGLCELLDAGALARYGHVVTAREGGAFAIGHGELQRHNFRSGTATDGEF